MPEQETNTDVLTALETIIANDYSSSEKLQELNLLSQKQVQLLQEIGSGNEHLGGLLDIIIQIINKPKEPDEEREMVSMKRTNELLAKLLEESKKPWNTTITLELE